MDKFHIDMPDDFEIDKQINFIVDKAIPTKKSLYTHLKNMYKEVGLSNLFYAKGEFIFISILTIVILLFGWNIYKPELFTKLFFRR
ncbi:hypothetical protein [Clostridium tarantellae]|uniref:Uncharacterized protein n=1 Tax=Clostridium tarantellae TaxID=39493 RepID=A0A6I1MQ42_9CLOT|nr:hypothetical protein [Clostridium tarantellae]MPQ44933.1 hypothetical protein [Clostridium tarantellae]